LIAPPLSLRKSAIVLRSGTVQLVEAGDGQLRLRQDFGGDDVSFLAELLAQCCLQIPNLAGVLDGRLDHNQLRARIDTIDRC